jgi:hypothetical protein
MRRHSHMTAAIAALAILTAGCATQSQSAEGVTTPVASAEVSNTPSPPDQPTVAEPTEVPEPVPPQTTTSDTPVVQEIQPEPAVPLCSYYNLAGAIVSAPCDPSLLDPSQQLTPVPPQGSVTEEATAITCDMVCTSTGCEQYQYTVLNCP